MTTFADKVYEMGGAPVGASLVPPGGKWFYVDATNGSASFDGLTPTTAKKTLAQAYALTTTGKNDVVCVLEATSGTLEVEAITWSNNLTHCIGMGSPVQVGQRQRIVVSIDDLAPFLTISGYGCIFRNVQIQSLRADADSKLMVTVSGDRNYFENVHFNGGGHATQAVDDGASVKLDGAEECLFKHCTFGCDTAVAATGYANVLFDDGAARNKFEDCIFQLYAGHAGVRHVEVVDTAGIDRWQIFERCLFINDCRTYTLTSAFVVPASMNSVTNFMLLKDCALIGSGDWDASDRGILYLNNGTITGGGNSGLFAAAAAT